MSEEVLEMDGDELRHKLSRPNLRLPSAITGEWIHQFADFLATQLRGEKIAPEYFLLEIELSFASLKRGTDPWSSAIITHPAVDRVPAVELLVRRDIPDLIRAVYPALLADQVLQIREKVHAQMRALTEV